MPTLEQEFGGARYTTSGVDFDLNWYGAKVHTIATTAASVEVSLPPANYPTLNKGGPVFQILNVGANAFDVVDSDGGAVVTVPASDCAILSIADNSTEAGTWRYVLLDIA